MPAKITRPMTSPMAGSSHAHPVHHIPTPASTTPTETPASATMCKYAPRTFRSCFRPFISIRAVTPLISTPAAATPIIVGPPTAAGSASRRTASQTIPPTATSSSMALARAARMVEPRSP